MNQPLRHPLTAAEGFVPAEGWHANSYHRPTSRVEAGVTRWDDTPLCTVAPHDGGYRIEGPQCDAAGRTLRDHQRIIELQGASLAEAKAEAELLLRKLGFDRV